MMKANAFEPQEEMPQPVPIGEHPFLKPVNDKDSKEENEKLGKVYKFFQRTKKDWEKPRSSAEDASKVFEEVPNNGKE